MLLKTKSGRVVELPSEEEDAEINAGIVADPDTFEWTEENFNNAVRFNDLPESLKTKLRGKQKAPTKVSTTVRFDADVLAAFRNSGRGWQTRMNDALKEWLKEHSPV
ncbi:MAG: BrnA antitoxin family protein [Methylomicrobium sp.]|nr:BrnA antitoxin family protein [Methylomicrobium sp.]